MRMKCKVMVDSLPVRKSASKTSNKVGTLKKGDTVVIVKFKECETDVGDIWAKIEGSGNWVKSVNYNKKTKKTVTQLKPMQQLDAKGSTAKKKKKATKTLNELLKASKKDVSKYNGKNSTKTKDDVKGNKGGIPNEPKRSRKLSGSSDKSNKSIIDDDAISMSQSIKVNLNPDTKPGKFWLYHSDIYNPEESGDYQIDIKKIDVGKDKTLPEILKKVRNRLNAPVGMSRENLNYRTHLRFNRFKIQYPDEYLRNSFGVIFFTRPDLNLFCDTVTDGDKSKGLDVDSISYGIKPQMKSNLRDYFLLMQNPVIGALLTKPAGHIAELRSHNFNPLLSNLAQGIEVMDDSIELLEYGETFTGYKLNYAKQNTSSITAGNLNIKFKETFDLAVTKTHQLWVDYESSVFKGTLKPKVKHIWHRELDYACNIYYFLLAEDMETILFWSKYYGCFPQNVPKSTFSYDFGSNVQFPDVSVTYSYIYRRDLSPQSLVEFNTDAGTAPYTYKSTISGKDAHSAFTWAGVPYVSTFDNTDGNGKLINSMYATSLQNSDGLKLRYRYLGTDLPKDDD